MDSSDSTLAQSNGSASDGADEAGTDDRPTVGEAQDETSAPAVARDGRVETEISSATRAKSSKTQGSRTATKRARRSRTPSRPKAKDKGTSARTRGGAKRSFPAATFETAMELPQAIQQFSAGQPVRRVTLFDHLGKSPDSGASRQLISNSSRYGLTIGSHHNEHLELSKDGRLATSPDVAPREQLRARFRLAIESIAPFKALYQRFSNNKLPAAAVMRDFLSDEGTPQDEVQECVETFIVNVKFLGLLRTLSGAERLLTIEHALEELTGDGPRPLGAISFQHARTEDDTASPATDWNGVCFYITPIGDEESDDRKHSDLFLGSVVEPAVEELGLRVVRADQIERPGMITTQSLEHILKARLVIADLSFLNPNVFYELCLRHVSGKPTVQIIRASDTIPFDVNQVRTIRLDTTDLYSFVPRLETYKTEIATQARQALEGTAPADNPLTVFYPDLRSALAKTT